MAQVVVLGVVVIGAPAAASAACSMGNDCPVVDAFTVTPSPPQPGSTALVSCSAHDPDGNITRFSLTTDAGTFSNGSTSIDLTGPLASSSSASDTWTAPAAAGAPVHMTCTAWDDGGFMPGEDPSDPYDLFFTVASTGTPILGSVVASPAVLFPAASTTVTATASDPGELPLSYAWSAPSGTITPGADPWTVQWTAGSALEVVEISVVVSNTSGAEVTGSTFVTVTGSMTAAPYAQNLGGALYPFRVAVAEDGSVFATDPRRRAVLQLSPSGTFVQWIPIDGRPLGLATEASGALLVGDAARGWIARYDLSGTLLEVVGTGFREPTDIAVDRLSGDIVVADSERATVRRFDASATELAPFPHPGTAPASVAFSHDGTSLYVGDADDGLVRRYSSLGGLVGTVGGYGTDAGEMIRPTGLAASASGDLYVVDAFRSQISVFDAGGGFLEAVGSWGTGVGELAIPLDASVDATGRLIVSNVDNQRLEVFHLPGHTTVTCPGDTDCDGLTDAFEVAHGLDPTDPTDAWADLDGDGLSNIGEQAAGTDPHVADSDGDGMSDGEEVGLGFDPLDATDNLPVAVAQADPLTEPTLVALDGSASFDPNGDPLEYEWTQTSGPVAVTPEPVAAPSLALRVAGVYDFSLRVWDGRIWSAASDVRVEVVDVPATADAGPDVGGTPGVPVLLDGRFSADANLDVFSWAWQQVEGPAVSLSGAGTPQASFVPAVPGLYAFELRLDDGEGLGAPARVEVIVDSVSDHVPVAVVADVLTASAGVPVTLDGTASVDTDGDVLTHSWSVASGPGGSLMDADRAVATFTPDASGVYALELVVDDGRHASAPATLELHVGAPPLGDAGPDQRVAVGETVALDCSGSSAAAPSCSWSQIEGVHVPIVAVDDQLAEFVPLDPGTYAFELSLLDGGMLGATDEVVVVVDETGGEIVPIAVAASNGPLDPGMTLTLDATGSIEGNGDAFSSTWTQVGGPRLVLDGTRQSGASGVPLAGGTYTFELRVDDGVTRSPPTTVSVDVTELPPDTGLPPGPTGDTAATPPTDTDVPTVDSGSLDTAPTDVVEPDPEGCGGGGCSSGGGSAVVWPLLLVATLLRRRSPALAVLAAVGLFASPPAWATDDPHVVGNGCDDCHQFHDSPGMALTNVAGNANLCRTCHAANGLLMPDAEQAVVAGVPPTGVSGIHHRWDAPASRPDLQVAPPSDTEMALRLDSGLNLMCSTCHDQHSQELPPFDPNASPNPGDAGRHFMRAANDANQMCVDCHSARDMTSADYNAGASLSHPVGVAVPGACPIGASGTDCTTCAAGFTLNGGVCEPDLCLTVGDDGNDCGEGLCSVVGDCAASTCGGGTYHSDVSGTPCLPDEACGGGSCSGVVGACISTPVDPQTVCDCPIGLIGDDCTTCATGFSGHPTCAADSCLGPPDDGNPCGYGSCANLPGDCNASECTTGEHHDDLTRTCEPDITCPDAAMCNGIAAACVDNPNGDDAHCSCPVGYSGATCSSCATGYSGYPTCTPDVCNSGSVGNPCGHGTCSAGASEFRICSEDFGDGNNQPCESATCSNDGQNVAGRVQNDCANRNSNRTMTYVFNTSSASGTSFKIWMRNVVDASWDNGEFLSCSVTGVTSVGTLNWNFTESGLQNGDNGPGCPGFGFTQSYCWMSADDDSAIQLDQGEHTLTCQIQTNADNEYFGWDGFIFTTNLAYVPDEQNTACNSDTTFAAGTCFGNWGPNVDPTPVCGCSTGYTGASCDQCDTGYAPLNGACVNTDPCSGVTCNNGGTCYVESDGTPTCDCTGQWYGATCDTCSATSGWTCSCDPGYTGVDCDQCDTGYVEVNGLCVATDPCAGVDCGSGSCYTDSSGAAVCDCPGEFWGANCENCDNTVRSCACDPGYTGDGTTCDECDAGYVAHNGTCVATDPCPTGDCSQNGYFSPPADADGFSQTITFAGTTSSATPATYLIDSAASFPAPDGLAGYKVRLLDAPNENDVVTIATNTATRVNFTGSTNGAIASGDRYEIDRDGNITNSIMLSSGFTSGNVGCMSCHDVHYADSDASTHRTDAGAGDGALLRREGDLAMCQGCHDYAMHNSANTSTTYGTWGTAFTCRTCHDTHDTPNHLLVGETIQGSSIDFRVNSGGEEPFGLATPGDDGPCQTCHTLTQEPGGAPRFRNSATGGDSGAHNPNSKCTSCHLHSAGFSASESTGGTNCSSCHSKIWDRMNGGDTTLFSGGGTIASKHTMGAVVGTNDSFDHTSPGATWAEPLDGVAPSNRSCTNMCHPDHPHGPGDPITGTHEDNLYEDARSTAGRNDNAMAGDYDGALPTGGVCMSCHQYSVQVGSEVHPALDEAAYDAGAHDFLATDGGFGLHLGGTVTRNCQKCHGDSEDGPFPDSSSPFGSVHFSEYDSLLRQDELVRDGNTSNFLCYECHDGVGGGDDVGTPLGRGNSHPVESNDGSHDEFTEGASSHNWAGGTSEFFSGGALDHVSCQDCHNPHEAGVTNHTEGTNAIAAGSPLLGVSGVYDVGTWGAWTVPTGTSDLGWIDPATEEWQICFKCHSTWAWGASGPPSGLTDQALEFNPANPGYHAVVGASKTTEGSYINGWGQNDQMYCSDCHESNLVSDGEGPHGSQRASILKGQWTANTGLAGNTSGHLCFECHPTGTYAEGCSTGSNSGFTDGSENFHCNKDEHAQCMACHGRTPHGWWRQNPIVDDTDPVAYRYPSSNWGFVRDSSPNIATVNKTNNWDENDCHNGNVGNCK